MDSDRRESLGRWLAFYVAVVTILVGVGTIVAWWILSAPQVKVTVRIVAPASQVGLDVYINGNKMGQTPFEITLDDAWQLSDSNLVPEYWPPNDSTTAATSRLASNYTVSGAVALTGVATRTEHILYVQEDDNGSTETIALRVRVIGTEEGSEAYVPDRVGAVYTTIAGGWNGVIKVEFVKSDDSP